MEKHSLFQTPPPKSLIYLTIIVLIGLNFWVTLPHIADRLLQADNDDLMRLVRIRDWQAGQSWFDNQQYRLLPPEGISLHWSRYIDAPIAGIIWITSWFNTTIQAEYIALALWPSLLLVLACCLIFYQTDRIFGTLAGCLAVAYALSWQKYGHEFTPGRIDHHNIQILLLTALFYFSLTPTHHPWRRGFIAGACFGFSLSIGLEMLPALLLIWGFSVVRFAFTNTTSWLFSFSLSALLSVCIALLSHTAPAQYLTPYCDALGVPVMILICIGTVACCITIFASKFIQNPWLRLMTLLTLSAIGILISWPYLGPCWHGPYGNVSPRVLDIIENKIIEARPLLALLSYSQTLFILMILPAALTTIIAFYALLCDYKNMHENQIWGLSLALLIAGLGLIASLDQVRAINLATATIPFLAAFGAVWLLRQAKNTAQSISVAVILIILSPPIVSHFLLSFQSDTPLINSPFPACRSQATVDELRQLPVSTLFSSMNLGTLILAYTPHNATSAPYHRSDHAFWNGSGALQSADALRAALINSQADYVVICKNPNSALTAYEQELLAGNLPIWLVPLATPTTAVEVFRVDIPKL